MDNRIIKIRAKGSSIPLRVIPGHFATNHSHINYYIDMTTLKTRLSEAQEVARSLVGLYVNNTIVDTIVCLEGTEIIGAFFAEELTKAGFMSRNAHQTIYIVTPEFNSNSQMIFRENIQPMVTGKNVILLMASITTGLTINKGLECIQYYGGILQGVSAIFSAVKEVNGIPINSVYTKEDLPDYESFDYRNCPYCKQSMKLDALVNSYGYMQL